MTTRVTVEVVYARAERQEVVTVSLPDGGTIERAIRESGLLARFPEIDLRRDAVGVFGARARLDDVLHAGDRVEIYRPLTVDPKEARRRRAKRNPKARAR